MAFCQILTSTNLWLRDEIVQAPLQIVSVHVRCVRKFPAGSHTLVDVNWSSSSSVTQPMACYFIYMLCHIVYIGAARMLAVPFAVHHSKYIYVVWILSVFETIKGKWREENVGACATRNLSIKSMLFNLIRRIILNFLAGRLNIILKKKNAMSSRVPENVWKVIYSNEIMHNNEAFSAYGFRVYLPWCMKIHDKIYIFIDCIYEWTLYCCQQNTKAKINY